MAVQTVDQLRSLLLPYFEKLPKPMFQGAFAYGECMEPGFNPKKQRFVVSLVFESLRSSQIPGLTELTKVFASNNIELGFLFSNEKVTNASDTFPLEFLNISKRSYLLSGESPLHSFTPNARALRHQCEREMRGLLMHLHREYILHSSSPKDLKALLDFTLPRFQPIFRGIYWLLNHNQYPTDSGNCLAFIDSHWKLNGLLGKIHSGSVDSTALNTLSHDYISAIEEITQTIDQLEVTP